MDADRRRRRRPLRGRRQSAAVGRDEGTAERRRLPRRRRSTPTRCSRSTLASGRIRWYDQVVAARRARPGLHVAARARLGTARAAGRRRRARAGSVIAWDRRTHRRVWETRRRRAPQRRRAAAGDGRVSVCPGLFGGALTPMAVARGLVFVPVVDLCMRGSATGYESLGAVNIDQARAAASSSRSTLATRPRALAPIAARAAFGCATVAGDVVFAPTFEGASARSPPTPASRSGARASPRASTPARRWPADSWSSRRAPTREPAQPRLRRRRLRAALRRRPPSQGAIDSGPRERRALASMAP